ncbi:MAG: InlB B-repeat-containing protein [Bacteroidales bacterium]|nr:InlB B-repeat-containing protein [Bacteroidales bacterium]MBO7572759.1 InlB B-repeat-containing protein [Bacteroidales bacterium]
MKKSIFLLFAIVSAAGMIAISGCDRPETYTVTFNPNGGTGTMQPQTFTEGEAQALTRNAFTYDGYTFTGWNTVQGGSGASYPDGYTLTATADMTLYAQWTSNGTNPTPSPSPTPGPASPNTLNGHEFVDLGLPSGLLWATCNVGANTPEEYGDYFAWGETAPKETYSWSTYRYCNGGDGYNTLTKYCNNAEYGNNGFTDNLTTLEASDDAATANWGAGWRMPTREEMQELFDNCTHEWTTQNGVSGRLFTGPNGNSIFLAAAGYRVDSGLDNAGSYGLYWSLSLYTGSPYGAWHLYFYSGTYDMNGTYRCLGLSVRPVCVSVQN